MIPWVGVLVNTRWRSSYASRLLVGSVPELRQPRTFVAVAEERNFTRAAERLHLAQQAVSKSVRQLERELGVELLERTTREVRLTPAGAALLTAGRETLAAADAAFARAREVGTALAGKVRIGATPAVGAAVLGEVVDVLRDGAPELSVAALELRPGEISRSLRDRDVDLVLARTWYGGPRSRALPCARPPQFSSSRPTIRSRRGGRSSRPSSTASACSPGARRARRTPIS